MSSVGIWNFNYEDILSGKSPDFSSPLQELEFLGLLLPHERLFRPVHPFPGQYLETIQKALGEIKSLASSDVLSGSNLNYWGVLRDFAAEKELNDKSALPKIASSFSSLLVPPDISNKVVVRKRWGSSGRGTYVCEKADSLNIDPKIFNCTPYLEVELNVSYAFDQKGQTEILVTSLPESFFSRGGVIHWSDKRNCWEVLEKLGATKTFIDELQGFAQKLKSHPLKSNFSIDLIKTQMGFHICELNFRETLSLLALEIARNQFDLSDNSRLIYRLDFDGKRESSIRALPQKKIDEIYCFSPSKKIQFFLQVGSSS